MQNLINFNILDFDEQKLSPQNFLIGMTSKHINFPENTFGASYY